jgi:hypothetical protein
MSAMISNQPIMRQKAWKRQAETQKRSVLKSNKRSQWRSLLTAQKKIKKSVKNQQKSKLEMKVAWNLVLLQD